MTNNTERKFEIDGAQLAEMVQGASAYVAENYVKPHMQTYGAPIRKKILQEADAVICPRGIYGIGNMEPLPDDEDLSDIFDEQEETFSQKLFSLVSGSGEKDSAIYKRAGIDRRLYSKIICNQNYSPSKSTALAFVFALKLDMSAANDLLSRAGYTLSKSVRRDVIIEYLLKNKVYDLLKVNAVLYEMGESIIGK